MTIPRITLFTVFALSIAAPTYTSVAPKKGLSSYESSFFQSAGNQPAEPCPANPAYCLTKTQMESLVSQYVAALQHGLGPNIMLEDTELSQIKLAIKLQITDTPYIYIMVQNNPMYNKNFIDHAVLTALINYIENRAYTYALRQTLHNQQLSHAVATTIRNKIVTTLQTYATLDAEQLIPFFGQNLKDQVNYTLGLFDSSYYQTAGSLPYPRL